jgi:hypothetical protein
MMSAILTIALFERLAISFTILGLTNSLFFGNSLTAARADIVP